MNLWNKFFGKKDSTANKGNALYLDGGIHFCKRNGYENMNMIFMIDSHEKIMVGKSPLGTMLVFNYVMDTEYCFSVIVPDSIHEVQAKLKNSSGTLVVSGQISDSDYTSVNGEIFCPIIGGIEYTN